MNRPADGSTWRWRGGALLAVLTVLLLAPFAGKAIHIDDPLFVWSARYIQGHLLDFYGFDVNWYGKTMPMWAVAKNPPGVAYFIAGVAKTSSASFMAATATLPVVRA